MTTDLTRDTTYVATKAKKIADRALADYLAEQSREVES